MNKLSKTLLESNIVSPVKEAVRELKAKGFDVDYEWDPHNVTDPFVRFYILDKMQGYMSILRDNLTGWTIIDVTEEGDDIISIEAKPPVL